MRNWTLQGQQREMERKQEKSPRSLWERPPLPKGANLLVFLAPSPPLKKGVAAPAAGAFEPARQRAALDLLALGFSLRCPKLSALARRARERTLKGATTADMEKTGRLGRKGNPIASLHRRRRVPPLRGAVALGLVIALAGCATMQQSVGGWFGAATPTPRVTPAAGAAPQVYYAGTEGLKVYSKPSASAKVVGKLSLHEKVTRYKLERGYSYVESDKSGARGWVDNAQLVRRLPAKPATAAPAPAEPEPEAPATPAAEEPEAPAAPEAEEAEEPEVPAAPEATATAVEPLPTPTNGPVVPAPKGSKGTPQGVAPSIFDPY